MSSKIKVDTIENVAGSGNVSLGSGHNLVVPGNITGQGTTTFSGDVLVDRAGGLITLDNNGHITSKQKLNAVTAGGRLTGTTNQGDMARIDLSQTTANQDGGFISLSTANTSGTVTESVRIDSSQRVMIGTTTEGLADGDNLTVSGTGNVGITLRSTSSNQNNIYFSDATSGAGEYAGYVTYGHSIDTLRLGAGGADVLRCLNAISGSGYTASSGSMVSSKPMVAIRATGQSRTDTYYDFPVDLNGGLYVIAGMSHDQSTATYAKFANFQIGHNATYMTVHTSEAQGGNGQCAVSKPNNTTLRVTFNKDESSGSGSYGTVEFVAVFGSIPC